RRHTRSTRDWSSDVCSSDLEFSQLTLPYELYDEQDVAHRVIYVEASRGCPFSCEFCLSSLEIPVRQVPLEPLLEQLERLLQRGRSEERRVGKEWRSRCVT